MAPDEELNQEEQEQENEQEQASGEPDKGKYPHGEKEQPIGQWWQPDNGYVETPIGGHVCPEKSRAAAGMDD